MRDNFDLYMGSPRPWLADGGLETDALFNHGFDLPSFASFTLLGGDAGRAYATRYFDGFFAMAQAAGTGLVLDTLTWRANAPWMARMGRGDEVAAVNRDAVAFARGLRARHPDVPCILNGLIGPAGDGYSPGAGYTPDAAAEAHRPQIRALADAGAEMLTAMTMTHAGEARGVVQAAAEAGLPVALSFTVETDGRLPSGQSLREAVAEVDATAVVRPAYFMVNCAHPDHFADVLDGADWLGRIGGIRANASRLSHAELDEATTLDDGDPDEFGRLYAGLQARLPAVRVIGGCCGTDHRHVGAAGAACLQGATGRGA